MLTVEDRSKKVSFNNHLIQSFHDGESSFFLIALIKARFLRNVLEH